MSEPIEVLCENCNGEFEITPIDDCDTIPVRYCVFCGAELDKDMDLDSLSFNDANFDE